MRGGGKWQRWKERMRWKSDEGKAQTNIKLDEKYFL